MKMNLKAVKSAITGVPRFPDGSGGWSITSEDALKEVVLGLSSGDRKWVIMNLRFPDEGNAMPYKEIGNLYGLSASRIQQMVGHTMRELRVAKERRRYTDEFDADTLDNIGNLDLPWGTLVVLLRGRTQRQGTGLLDFGYPLFTGIRSLTFMRDSELLEIRGIGEKRLSEIRAAIERYLPRQEASND